MLVNNLAITYKCYSSIGNSLDLPLMMKEVLRTFVSETYAVYGLYSIEEDDDIKELASFGKIDNFDPFLYDDYKEVINKIYEEDKIILILRLEYGSMYLVIKQLNLDVEFFISMFESFINKLNLSIKSCLNVHKMKKNNELLREQKKELEAANKSKDDFLANMSHELKTPLNSINVISSVMKENKNGNLSARDIKNLEIIQSSGNYLLDLINDVLDLSKLESGRIVVDYSEINLLTLLDEIYNMFLPQTKEKGINLYFEFDKEIEPNIYSDEKKIKQIVKNLLSNAIKFVEKGKSIYLRVKDEDEQINISVKDEGIGIPQNRLSDIFDRFKQADSSTTRKFGGTGLGLAITKELLELLKGSIFVKSKVGIGTTFYVTIPKNSDAIKCLDILTLDDEYNKKKKIVEIEKQAISKNILIYNTDAVKFINIVITLQKDHKLTQVRDMEELLEKIDNNFDVLIVDSNGISKHELNILKETYKKDIYVIKDNIVDIPDIIDFIGR
ncbi:HAMP domain-containing sensor histidine kinase [Halarcobacter sp.]|uniref:sensor histidine kinase n=1 Tax=Halarcobacter sp. TaxID=2321133 RepID=UPI002AA5F4B2|nr:HAMP domain-containing sensor histidine kinase [Halarcobacter sp.]